MDRTGNSGIKVRGRPHGAYHEDLAERSRGAECTCGHGIDMLNEGGMLVVYRGSTNDVGGTLRVLVWPGFSGLKNGVSCLYLFGSNICIIT